MRRSLQANPIIGAGHFLFRKLLTDSKQSSSLTIMTKTGPVPILYDATDKLVSAKVLTAFISTNMA